MKCGKCGAINPDGNNFCKACGSRLERALSPNRDAIYCGFCGQLADDDAMFCTGCGRPFYAPLKPTGDKPRMVLTIIDKYAGNRQSGMSKTGGRLLIFADRIEFLPRIGSVSGAADAQNGAAGKIEVYPFRNIESCVYSPYALQMPALELTFSDGGTLRFGRMNKEAEIRAAADCIARSLAPSPQSLQSGGTSPVRGGGMFSFVMPIANMVPIEDYGTAILGAVQTGAVKAGDTVFILGADSLSKGSFEVRSVAVNKAIAPQASAGDNDVALLLFCPPTVFKSGDKACF